MADNISLVFQSPLNEDHLHQINTALANVKVAHQHIQLATRAGIDVSMQKAALDDAEKRLLAIKQVYFPGR